VGTPITLGDVGDAIRARRLELHLTQEGLALAAGIDRSYIGQLETGRRNLSLLNLFVIADALTVAPSTLLADAERRAGQRGEQAPARRPRPKPGR
jgi:transcriptional regulator with XRE-family HTH domain